jgi:tetratricopeptide (TPR) repeat protein
MDEKDAFNQLGTVVPGPQTNVAGNAQGPVLSGEFHGNVSINEQQAAPKIIPLQKPPKVPHFVGRKKEIENLLKDLLPGRVITICGPGGMGKTALVAETVWEISPANKPPNQFPDGIIFHTFYHKRQAALALEAIARAYGEDPQPSPLEAARRALGSRQALIILDGTEAADDLPKILSVTGNCGVLITTRRHSDAPDDFSDLPPLPQDKAVELLQSWAGEMALDEAVSLHICDLLGCLPLAVFLAGRYMAQRRQKASEYLIWLEKTPLAALDLGKRQHQSIPLLMEHSLAKVSDPAQDCLSVAGILAMKPFEPEVVAHALGIPYEEANNSLGELVDYGILLRPDSCYQVTHALAHTYARTKLSQRSDSLTRLADYYNKFIIQQLKQGLPGYAILGVHLDHILAVQSACSRESQWDAVRNLTRVCDSYLNLQGHWEERVFVLQLGLKAAQALEERKDEAWFLTFLGIARKNMGEFHEAIKLHEQARAIFQKIGNRRGEGSALNSLGIAYRKLGEYRKSIVYHEMALVIDHEIGYRRGEGAALGNIGSAYKNLGETRKAIEYHEKAFAIDHEIGYRRGEGIALGNLGSAYDSLGEYQKAIEYHQKALAIHREIGYRRGEGTALGNLGSAYKNLGETRKALDYYEKRLDIAREIGDRLGEGNGLLGQAICYEAMKELDQAISKAEQALNIFEQIESPDASYTRDLLSTWRSKI